LPAGGVTAESYYSKIYQAVKGHCRSALRLLSGLRMTTNTPTPRPHERLGTHWLTLRLHALFVEVVPSIPRRNRERTATRDDLSRLRVALAEAVDLADVTQLDKARMLALRIAVRFENLLAERRLNTNQFGVLNGLLHEIEAQLAKLGHTDPGAWLETIPSHPADQTSSDSIGGAFASAGTVVADAVRRAPSAPVKDEEAEQVQPDVPRKATQQAARAPQRASASVRGKKHRAGPRRARRGSSAKRDAGAKAA
jgi:hypothetical protein